MSGINRKGLTKAVECKSVPGATVDIIIIIIIIMSLFKEEYTVGNTNLP